MREPTVLTDAHDSIGLITLNRPAVLNAWDRAMRALLVAALDQYENDPAIRAIVLTGAGDRAFSAGQDLNEAKSFDADGGEAWLGEWHRLYGRVRSLTKPFVVALNGVAAGSAFQLSLLADIRIAHPAVTMGQPEINSGIASTLGPWIMREILGLARTIELTLTGRMMDADECFRLGVVTRIVAASSVLPEALAVAADLASKPAVAMRLNKKRFCDVTEKGFLDALQSGIAIQRESYGSGEPAKMMETFLQRRAARKVT